MKSSIALVVPVFNPHPGWEKLLHQRFTELSMALAHIDFKLYLVNDGSAVHVGKTEVDYLRNQLPEFHFTDLPQNQGKGYALRQAVQQTSEPFTVYTDADMPFTLQSMEAVINALPQNDIAFGIKQKAYYEQLPLQRKMVSRVLQKLIKLLFPALPVSDTQCGLKGMNTRGKEIFLQTKIDRYLFDLEFILYAAKNKLKIKPIPVELRPGIVFGNMKTSVLLEESRNLWKILRAK